MMDYIVIDLANLIARSETVTAKYLSTTTGLPSGHVFRAYRSILKLKRDHDGELIFALEGKNQKRYEMYPEYKAQRLEWRKGIADGTIFDPRPDVKEMCAYMKCRSIQADGLEADDAIASFCKANESKKILVVSTDQDMWQLLKYQHVEVQTLKGLVSRQDVDQTYGTSPQNIAMIKAIYGDKSDNLPCVKGLRWPMIKEAFGVGVKMDPTSFFMWAEQNATPVARKIIFDNRDQIEMVYKMVSLEFDSDLKYENLPGDADKLLAFMTKFECKSLYGTIGELT